MLYFWINLERRQDRFDKMRRLMSIPPFGLNSKDVRRVKALEPEDLKFLCRKSSRSGGEIGCLSSHLECLRLGCIDDTDCDEWILVGEDDVLFFRKDVDIKKILDKVPHDCGVCQLFTGHPSAYGKDVPLFVDWNKRMFSTLLYACRKESAKELLSSIGVTLEIPIKEQEQTIDIRKLPFLHVADEYLYQGMKACTLSVQLCCCDVDLGSDLHLNNHKSVTVWYEGLRVRFYDKLYEDRVKDFKFQRVK